MNAPHRWVWVVEINFARGDCGGRSFPWSPTLGVQLTRSQGRKELARWREGFPADRVRLTRYMAQEKR
jgi:hypothetical protein